MARLRLAVPAVALAGLSLGLSACSSRPAGGAGSAGATPLVDNCGRGGTARPALIILACADGNIYAQHLVWTSWGPSEASGSGEIDENDCQPDCASGRFHGYPVRVQLGQVVPTSAGPRFSELKATFTADHPPGPSTVTLAIPTKPLGG